MNPHFTLPDVVAILPSHLIAEFTRQIRKKRAPEVNKEGRLVYYSTELREFIDGHKQSERLSCTCRAWTSPC